MFESAMTIVHMFIAANVMVPPIAYARIPIAEPPLVALARAVGTIRRAVALAMGG